MVNRLVEFAVRVLSPPRFVYYRSRSPTPLTQWGSQATRFDESVRSAAESILGVPFTDQVYRQACLTPRLGGFGLRRTVDHAEIAFTASWHESMSTCDALVAI